MKPVKLRTKYIGPTDTRGSRIRAWMDGKQLTIPYDHGASCAHAKAAHMLAQAVYGTASIERLEMTNSGYVFAIFPNDLESSND
jgi:hypothetical protein